MGGRNGGEIKMNILATLYDNRHGVLYDISQVISDVKIKTQLIDQPGKCTFTMVKTSTISFWEGATVSIKISDVGMFKGYVVTKERTEDVNIINVTCLDQKWYLKNKDSRVFNATADEIFKSLCEDFVLKYKVINPTGYKLPTHVYDDKTLYQMMQDSIDRTLIGTGSWYIIRDNYGVLEFVDILNLNSGYILGDESGVITINYKTDISEDVYNQIVLYRDNSKTKKRELYIVNDTINGGRNLKEWGILQLYQSVDENLNEAQIELKARGMLKLYNSKQRTLKLSVIGIPSISAGSLIGCRIKDLGDISLDSMLLVEKCEHSISESEHIMSLELRVMI